MIDRYATPEMNAIWSEEARLARLLAVELAACRAWSEEGRIPPQAMKEIEERAGFDVDRVHEIEKRTKHDVIAFVSAVAERIGPSGRFVHLGLTSSDVLDTATGLQFRDALDLILVALEELRDVSGRLAWEHRLTPTVGRTHGVHAEPTTFGLKLLNVYAQLGRDRERILRAREECAVGKISGAVGTYANCPPEIEARTCELLGLTPDPVSNQIVQRDRFGEALCSIALCGGTLERLALEIRHLQRTEVLEAMEPFSEGQKGSSAMPHKKNPVNCEKVCGMARLLRSYAQVSLENLALWHERDISHSSTERIIWPDAFHAIHHMIRTMTSVLGGLRVFPDRMRANMEITRGLLFSGRVMLALVEEGGMTREEAYALVQDGAMKVWSEGGTLRERLLADPRLGEPLRDRIDEWLDEKFFFRHVETVFGRYPELRRQA
jgi:adenylosuccinate lyase